MLVRAVLADDATRAALSAHAGVAVAFAIYGLVVWLNVDSWRSHDQFFVERDPSLSYPYLDSTVSNEALAAMSTLLPLACIVLAVSARVKFSPTRVGHAPGSVGLPGPLSEDADPKSDPVFASRVDAVRALMFEIVCYCQALALTMGTYNALKSFVGRLRPNFFAACDYKGYKHAMSTGNYTDYLAATTPGAPGDLTHCRAARADVDEASLSFPSGHAGLSFVAMTWSTMALIRALSVERRYLGKTIGASSTDVFRSSSNMAPVVSAARAAACLPMAYATYVACTRVVDYKHRPADVIAGALIGAVFAWACAPRHLSGWGVRLAKPAEETNRRPV